MIRGPDEFARFLCSVKTSAACHLACLDLQVSFSLLVKGGNAGSNDDLLLRSLLLCARHYDWHDFVLHSQHPCEIDPDYFHLLKDENCTPSVPEEAGRRVKFM